MGLKEDSLRDGQRVPSHPLPGRQMWSVPLQPSRTLRPSEGKGYALSDSAAKRQSRSSLRGIMDRPHIPRVLTPGLILRDKINSHRHIVQNPD